MFKWRVLGSIRLTLVFLKYGGMYLQTMEISTVMQLETAITWRSHPKGNY